MVVPLDAGEDAKSSEVESEVCVSEKLVCLSFEDVESLRHSLSRCHRPPCLVVWSARATLACTAERGHQQSGGTRGQIPYGKR